MDYRDYYEGLGFRDYIGTCRIIIGDYYWNGGMDHRDYYWGLLGTTIGIHSPIPS